MPNAPDDDDFAAALADFDGEFVALDTEMEKQLHARGWYHYSHHAMSMRTEEAVMDARMVTKYVDYLPSAARVKTFSRAVSAGIVL